jgi:hypothetical protein
MQLGLVYSKTKFKIVKEHKSFWLQKVLSCDELKGIELNVEKREEFFQSVPVNKNTISPVARRISIHDH